MTKSEAIKKYCFDCSGDDKLEVLFCSEFDCSLWEFRCGMPVGSYHYNARLRKAKQNHPEMVKKLEEEDIDISKFG